MVIAHNISAINTYKSLGIAGNFANKAMEKLSSGFKINKAADDAAGLSISEKMRSQIRGLNQASENAENGISLIQTAEGALNEVHSILQRMRELSVQAATDTNAQDDRDALQKEMDQLFDEIDRIGETTEFNGMKLLHGEHTFKEDEGFHGVLDSPYVITDASFSKNGMNTQLARTDFGSIRFIASSDEYINHDYYAGILDLSGMDTAEKVQDLKNTGISVTCSNDLIFTCIKFVDGDELKIKPSDGMSFGDTVSKDEELSVVIELGIDGCNSGKDVITKLLDGCEEVNTELRKLKTGASSVDLSKYGLSEVQTKQDNLSRASQVTDKGYKFVSTWMFYKDGSALSDTIDRHMIMFGAEYDEATDTYGSKLYLTDPRLSSAKDYSNVEGNQLGSIRTGVYGTSILMDTETKELSLHVGANSNQCIKVTLPSISCLDLDLGKYDSNDGSFTRFDVTTRSNANSAINKIDNAIKIVSNTRSTLGAMQNRLEYTINNLNTTAENMTASESTIRDVDMADEMMEYTKNNILQQAAQAMLVQSNSRPQMALQLLG